MSAAMGKRNAKGSVSGRVSGNPIEVEFDDQRMVALLTMLALHRIIDATSGIASGKAKTKAAMVTAAEDALEELRIMLEFYRGMVRFTEGR